MASSSVRYKVTRLQNMLLQVFCVAWSADGKRLASGSQDTLIKISGLEDNMRDAVVS